MCLVLFAWRHHPTWALVLAGNRDEARARASAPLGAWPADPSILGGRDLVSGGSWLGVAARGRFAAVTNVRRPDEMGRTWPRSRGALVADFLGSELSAQRAAAVVEAEGEGFGGFNLLLGDGEDLWYASNRQGALQRVAPGVHGLSNAALDTPWPKVRTGRDDLASALEQEVDAEEIFGILSSREVAPDHQLPDTGVGLDLERLLAPRFLAGEVYGTRASTVLCLTEQGSGFIEERRFGDGGVELGRTRLELVGVTRAR